MSQRAVCSLFPNSFTKVVSYTTRQPRHFPDGSLERDGVDYNFVSRDWFDKEIKLGHFIEHAEVHTAAALAAFALANFFCACAGAWTTIWLELRLDSLSAEAISHSDSRRRVLLDCSQSTALLVVQLTFKAQSQSNARH